ncbi:hypothetical protein DPMN_110691 [Dreissena polymorpha]|uniref:Uncharacterized protein n=1 Tax=Dreissena polymorpha TaxID=45954 RepID=A0A9D4KCH2_DREPO|nr:hypothetical protein DPMN_110691 [Dreissena polymorpha]
MMRRVCDLIHARSLLLKAGLLVTEMRAYCVFHSVQKDAIKHLSWDRQQRDSSVVGELEEFTLFALC